MSGCASYEADTTTQAAANVKRWLRAFAVALLAPSLLALAAEGITLDAAIERVASERPGITDVFFLGFAGYGEQGVFRKEEEFARRVFGERFGSSERSLALVNDSDDRETFPLATVSSLHQAIALMGEKMDRDEDVLVLMITSHGNKKAIAVTNGDMKLAQLRPKDLRKALDDAGIRWRVIVVSACFAGTFIKPLKTDETLIVTAADAKHSSFGCEDERELTYFGEAFLRDALPNAPSIEAAFQQAREIVRRREKDEGQVHSNPQLFVGSAIRAKLAPLEAAHAPGTSDSYAPEGGPPPTR